MANPNAGLSSRGHNSLQAKSALERLVGAIDVDHFIRNQWEQSFRSGQGPAGGYRNLFTWDDLNRVLTQQRLSRHRLIVYRGGKPISAAEFQYGDGRDFLLKDAPFLHKLEEGSTLIINCIEETHEPLRDIAIEVRKLFTARVDINLYAAWGDSRGFDTHFDTQDNFIIQLAGRKHWKVWEPTRSYPIKGDVTDPLKPDAQPVWDGDLTEGSWFYIPRGWWHVAHPCGEPCMHLTVTVWPFNGIDLLVWAAERCRVSETVRQNLPVLREESARQGYLDQLRSDIAEQLTLENLEYFLKERMSVFHYPSLRLPSLTSGTQSH